MNPSKGIFGSVPESPDSDAAASSPFKALAGEKESATTNPFGEAPKDESPFATGGLDAPKPGAPPEPEAPRSAGPASPFELAEPEEEFGYDAPGASPPAPS